MDNQNRRNNNDSVTFAVIMTLVVITIYLVLEFCWIISTPFWHPTKLPPPRRLSGVRHSVCRHRCFASVSFFGRHPSFLTAAFSVLHWKFLYSASPIFQRCATQTQPLIVPACPCSPPSRRCFLMVLTQLCFPAPSTAATHARSGGVCACGR